MKAEHIPKEPHFAVMEFGYTYATDSYGDPETYDTVTYYPFDTKEGLEKWLADRMQYGSSSKNFRVLEVRSLDFEIKAVVAVK